jgi:hypothetical protein
VDDQCHGQPGEVGSCTLGVGSYIASVACEVRLDNGVLFEACIATTSCAGGAGPTCGG